MVGVAEHEPSARRGHPFGGHRLDRGGGADRHKHRRVDDTMRGREPPAPRRAIARQQLKADGHRAALRGLVMPMAAPSSSRPLAVGRGRGGMASAAANSRTTGKEPGISAVLSRRSMINERNINMLFSE